MPNEIQRDYPGPGTTADLGALFIFHSPSEMALGFVEKAAHKLGRVPLCQIRPPFENDALPIPMGYPRMPKTKLMFAMLVLKNTLLHVASSTQTAHCQMCTYTALFR